MSEASNGVSNEVHKPPDGWERLVVIRQSGQEAGRADIYHSYRGGPRLRSKNEVGRYCMENKLPFNVSQFDFSTKNRVPAKGDDVVEGEIPSTSGNVDSDTNTGPPVSDDDDPYTCMLGAEFHPEAFCTEVQVPTTYIEATHSPQASEWKKAMEEEMCTLKTRGVYTPVKKPKDKKIIGSRWVYSVKKDSKGKIAKYRARLVAQGNTQRKGFDYFERICRL